MTVVSIPQVAFDLANSGTWQDLPDGRLWRLRIQSPGAVSHNLGITRFELLAVDEDRVRARERVSRGVVEVAK